MCDLYSCDVPIMYVPMMFHRWSSEIICVPVMSMFYVHICLYIATVVLSELKTYFLIFWLFLICTQTFSTSSTASSSHKAY